MNEKITELKKYITWKKTGKDYCEKIQENSLKEDQTKYIMWKEA